VPKFVRGLVAASTLALATTGLIQVVSMGNANASTASCAPQERTMVVQSGTPTYASLGAAAGKYNASSSTSSLHYSFTTSTTRKTAWTGTVKASVSWGIAQVEASSSFSVESSVTAGTTVTDDLPVPGHYYGYDQPKVEYRTFHIYHQDYQPTCSWSTTLDYGYLQAITAYPFFSSCVATSACTPKP
jgi:hypothetical protein